MQTTPVAPHIGEVSADGAASAGGKASAGPGEGRPESQPASATIEVTRAAAATLEPRFMDTLIRTTPSHPRP